MDDVSPKLDFSAVRIHHAARVIAFYVARGKRRDFLRPLLGVDNPAFSFYLGSVKRDYLPWHGSFIQDCLIHWPLETLDEFYPFPIVQLMRRHSREEQKEIIRTLARYYGYKHYG